MEAVAIDAFGLAAKVGWDVYPVCHSEADPSVVSRAISMGIGLFTEGLSQNGV